ncbi:MAG: M28 family peptidase [FCB group bacterium]|nr:M28 family peptidase [FCB group bacterium]
MKKITIISLALLSLLNFAMGADYRIVRISAPFDYDALAEFGFQPLHYTQKAVIGLHTINTPLPENAVVLCDYLPEKGELFSLSIPSSEEAAKLTGYVTVLYSDQNEVIIQASAEQLQNLPEIRAEWKRITVSVKPYKYEKFKIPATDEFHPFVQELVNQVSYTQYLDYLQSLQDFGTRNTLTTGCDNAAAWILGQFQSMGLTAYYNNFTIGSYNKRNVIGELPGLLYPDSILFITAHYDATAGSPWSPEPISPGADDNGTGTACFLECARILSQYNFEKTIRFVGFAGEEQGLYGSEDYVADLVSAGDIVAGCINYDMVGYSGDDPPPPDLMIYSDNNPRSQALAYKLEEAALTFVPNDVEPVVEIDPSVVYSDHSPFWDAGFPAILGIEEEAWGPDFNPYYHSVNDLIVNCDIDYAVNCTKAAIAALADYAVPIVEGGPYLAVNQTQFDEIIGNGNGQPDPGETISILVTLINAGDSSAFDIEAVLSTIDPFLTVTQNYSAYPDLIPQGTGQGFQAYVIEIDQDTPHGTYVSTELAITAAGGYTHNVPINFMAGDPAFEPTGPDAYGYLAYDPLHEPGLPGYQWVEISADSGGQGTMINFTQDDQVFQFDLPFTFRYYGQDYSRYTIATNGWIGMGDIFEEDYSNSGIPNSDGPEAMIAPYWEDLSPQRANSGKVWQWYDTVNHQLIVEYNHIEQYAPTGSFETFQVILFDPAYYITATGDGEIKFQYKNISNTFQSEGTVGIEDFSETIGLQYFYDGGYDVHASEIANGTAILFTTISNYPAVTVNLTPAVTPIQIPASGGFFDFNIEVANNEAAAVTFDVWCDVTLPSGSIYGPVIGPVNLTVVPGFSGNRDRTQNVPANAPAGNYSYNAYVGIYPTVIWNSDDFPFEKLTTGDGFIVSNWNNTGESFEKWMASSASTVPEKYSLHTPYPNPFNPSTVISFELRDAGEVSLVVYDVQGREVQSLVSGHLSPGYHEAVFDGSELSSGMYFVRLEAGDFRQVRKMLLIK